MTEEMKPSPGRIAWADLTVPNADDLREFYAAVVGWRPEPVDMGGYSDYNMTDPETGIPMVGVCHQRGVNEAIPPAWLLYFTVPDLEAAMEQVRSRGGEIVDGPRSGFCVFRDPAGAVAALYEMRM